MMSADAKLDITDVVCPVTFVKAKVQLEEMQSGQILEILLQDGEAIANVPRSLKDEGHKVLDVTNNQDGTYTMLVEKDGLNK
jgi:TusA-related sulfurtransferase